MKDISFDLETLGTSANSKILSIGAAYFDRYSGAIGRTLYLVIDTEQDPDGAISQATLDWWRQQDESAQSVFKSAGKLHPLSALTSLHDFMVGDECVWGNGAGFDITMLDTMAERHGLPTPWKFWNVRDMRTVVDLAGNPALPFVGTKHNAVDDAVHQAKVIAECIRRLTR